MAWQTQDRDLHWEPQASLRQSRKMRGVEEGDHSRSDDRCLDHATPQLKTWLKYGYVAIFRVHNHFLTTTPDFELFWPLFDHMSKKRHMTTRPTTLGKTLTFLRYTAGSEAQSTWHKSKIARIANQSNENSGPNGTRTLRASDRISHEILFTSVQLLEQINDLLSRDLVMCVRRRTVHPSEFEWLNQRLRCPGFCFRFSKRKMNMYFLKGLSNTFRINDSNLILA